MTTVVSDAESTPNSGAPTAPGSRRFSLGVRRGNVNRAAKWTTRILEFCTFQGIIKAISAVSGLLIVRLLPKSEYALYSIGFQMQAACNSLADLGIGMGVSSIGGRVHGDPRQMGELLSTALRLRRYFAVIALGFCLPLTAWMLRRNGATWMTTGLLCLAVVNLVIPHLTAATLRFVPWLHGEYRKLQWLELTVAAIRLAMLVALAAFYLDAFTAVLVGGFALWWRLGGLRRLAYEKAEQNAPPNEEYRSELIRLSRRQLPNVLYYCFQGQIALLILTWFGNTEGIADISALGRLAVFLGIVGSAINGVLTPHFARSQSPKKLRSIFLAIVGFTAIAFLPVVVLSIVAPNFILWLLGNEYSDLTSLCVIAITIGCIKEFGRVVTTMNRSKAWIAVSPRMFIPVTVIVQVVAAMSLDLRQVQNVLWFQMATSSAGASVYLADSIVGLVSAGTTADPNDRRDA